jgi:hypothetical protein
VHQSADEAGLGCFNIASHGRRLCRSGLRPQVIRLDCLRLIKCLLCLTPLARQQKSAAEANPPYCETWRKINTDAILADCIIGTALPQQGIRQGEMHVRILWDRLGDFFKVTYRTNEIPLLQSPNPFLPGFLKVPAFDVT